MTAILRRAPFFEDPTEVTLGDEQVLGSVGRIANPSASTISAGDE